MAENILYSSLPKESEKRLVAKPCPEYMDLFEQWEKDGLELPGPIYQRSPDRKRTGTKQEKGETT